MKRKTSRVKKNSKAGTRKPKDQEILAIAAEIEKEFFNLPIRLVGLCKREQALLKQREAKLKASYKTASTKHTHAIKKMATLKKSSKPAARKQIVAVKKSATLAARVSAEINRDIKINQRIMANIAAKQAGFAFLAKELPKLRKKTLSAGRQIGVKSIARKKRKTRKSVAAINMARKGSQHSVPYMPHRIDATEVT